MGNDTNGSHHDPEKDDIHFTDREIQIIRMICEEKSTHDIAKAIKTSPRSVSRCREKLLKKTHSKNAIGILKYAVDHRIYVIE